MFYQNLIGERVTAPDLSESGHIRAVVEQPNGALMFLVEDHNGVLLYRDSVDVRMSSRTVRNTWHTGSRVKA